MKEYNIVGAKKSIGRKNNEWNGKIRLGSSKHKLRVVLENLYVWQRKYNPQCTEQTESFLFIGYCRKYMAQKYKENIKKVDGNDKIWS